MALPTHTKRASKIDGLQALIDHPRTPANEREAAKAMLARLMAKRVGNTTSGYVDTTWYGSKYNDVPAHCATPVITKRLRDDLKAIRAVAKKINGGNESESVKLHDPIGDAPAGIKFGVTMPHHGSINITVRNIPDDWGWVQKDRYNTGHVADWPSDALRTLGNALRALANAYNHDNSDTMTDYFDKRFYLSVNACKGDDKYGVTIA